MLLYLIRHGQTDWNLLGKLQGCSDTLLNDQGIQMARLTAEKLKDISFTKAISSPLKRAFHTCELILGDRLLKPEADQDLIELSFGDYEGCCIREDCLDIPDPSFQEYFFHHPDQYITPPNGESLLELRKRASHFIEKLCQRKDWQNDTILATAHGGIICAILAELHQYDMKHFWGKGVPSNCSVTIIRIENQTPIIECENQILWKD